MDIYTTITASLVVFITLIANAFTKIMLMLLGAIIAFLALPQSRAAAMFGIAVISAFAGGIIIDVYSVQESWPSAAALCVAFGCGFLVYPFLIFFRKFNILVSNDDEIVELLFSASKSRLKKFLGVPDKTVDNQSDVK